MALHLAAPRAQHLLLALVLALAWACSSAQTDDCFANPVPEECRSYQVADAVLERDLSKLCRPALGGQAYSGWPAACTLWHECKQGRGSGPGCHPLALLQTLCNERGSFEEPDCLPYQMFCAPQSVVEQCQQHPIILELGTAMQFHTAVQQLCNSSAGPGATGPAGGPLPAVCSNCTALSQDPDKVQVQVLDANCPDPLGTLSSLCLDLDFDAEQQGESCAGWEEFCASEAGHSFTGLCGGEDNATGAPAPAPSAPPANSTDSAAKATASGSTAPAVDCYADPGLNNCRTFQMPDADAQADIEAMCTYMPSMVGCSLWQQCSSGAAHGSYCQPFSVLGSICTSTPALSGCQRWSALCGTSGSVVQQCVTAAPIRNVLMTTQTMDAVVKACSSSSGANVAGCEQCRAAGWSGTGCPNPLAVMSQLCQGTPTLAQCSNLAAMCAEAGSTFSSLCGTLTSSGTAVPTTSTPAAATAAPASGTTSSDTSSSGSSSTSDADVVKMYLHASMSAMIIFKSWVPSSGGAYIASCLAVIVIAMAVQALKAVNVQLEARWMADRAAAASCPPVASQGFRSAAHSSMDGKDLRRSSALSSVSILASALGSSKASTAPRRQPFITSDELGRNMARACLTGAAVFGEYILMLVAMTFNLGLILSATLGFGLGALTLGHLGERAAMAVSADGTPAGAIVSSMQPTSEADLELHYVPFHQQAHPQPLQQPMLRVQ